MSENSEKDNKPQVTSKGVSGTKELKVRRRPSLRQKRRKQLRRRLPRLSRPLRLPKLLRLPRRL